MSSNIRPENMERITTKALADAFIDEQIALIRDQVGDKKVLLALSGGVDSSVVAALLIKAIGKQLVSVHVNHGLMRKGESEEVIEVFRNQLDANLVYVDASERFLNLLAGVADPEKKRKIIGAEFISVFAEEASKLEGISFLAISQIPKRLFIGIIVVMRMGINDHRSPPQSKRPFHHPDAGKPGDLPVNLQDSRFRSQYRYSGCHTRVSSAHHPDNTWLAYGRKS